MPEMIIDDCPLCHPQDETVLWQDHECRVILVSDADYPGFCRVIWRAHVREMTDLPLPAREKCMRLVWAVEQTIRDLLQPDKVNLASLGNMVPHLHWHVIPRFADDPHFPDPVWVPRRRVGEARSIDGALVAQALARNINTSS